jgi:hypothetical protein
MTDFSPATGRDRNYYSNPHLVTPHYTNGNGVNYFYPQGQLQLPTNGTHATYNPVYASSPHSIHQSSMYMSNNPHAGTPYSLAPPPRGYPAQARTLPYSPYHQGVVPTQRSPIAHPLRRPYDQDLTVSHINDIESQESINEDTMLSEPIVPALEGYPDSADFDRLMTASVAQSLQATVTNDLSYVEGLSPKKQDKALISARRARNIKTVLLDKKTTTVESAQFRYAGHAKTVGC